MPLYPNGSIPLDRLVSLDSGDGKHLTTPTSRAKWYALRAKVLREKGVTLEITSGWNAFRPLREQYAAKAWACNQGNCLGAAQPGQSSHGGTWAGPATGWVWVDAMAFDIHNYWRVPWDYFKAACKSVGLLADGIPLSMSGGVSEKHHIIDLDPWGAVPASLESEDLEVVTEQDIKKIGDYAAQAVWGTIMPATSEGTPYASPEENAARRVRRGVDRSSRAAVYARESMVETRAVGSAVHVMAGLLSDRTGVSAADILDRVEKGAREGATAALTDEVVAAIAERVVEGHLDPDGVKAALREAFAEAFGGGS